MFEVGDFVRVVAPDVQACNLKDLLFNCRAQNCGIRVDLAGVVLIDHKVNGAYKINVTMCNGLVVPHPILTQGSTSVLYYDNHCIEYVLRTVQFATNVRMVGDNVVSFRCPLSTHIALPEKAQSLRIASCLQSEHLLFESCSINTAIASHFKQQLPVLKICSPSLHPLNKTAFVFRTDAHPQVLRTIDIRRCYTNALLEDMNCWLHFSVMDDVQNCEPEEFLKVPGRYWVKTENYFPLKGTGWYYSTLLCYARETNIEFTAHYKLAASILYPSCLFKSAVTKTKGLLSSDDAKVVINRFIGMLKTKPTAGRTSVLHKTFATSRKHEADAFLALEPGSFMTEVDGRYYCRRPILNNDAMESSRHFYDQIIERSWIMVHRLWRKLEACGGTLICVKTDSVTASFSSQSDASLFEITEHYREEPTPSTWPLPISLQCDDEPILDHSPEIVNVGSDHVWDTEPQCIVGRAGTGKSRALSRILEMESSATIISPTNRAASAFGNRGMTIHAFFDIHDISICHVHNKRLRHIAKTNRLLLVDEVFMCSAWMMQALYQLSLLGVKIIVAGDPYQLPAVSGAQLQPSNLILRHICNSRFFGLVENIRCKVDISSTLVDSVVNGECAIPECVTRCPFDPLIRRHLTYTNACAERLNDIMLKQEIRRHRKVLWYCDGCIQISSGISKVPDNAICFTNNTPVIIRETCTYGTRNQFAIITRFNGSTITLDSKCFNLTKEFFEIVYAAYAITIHKAQGSTIDERYQIHEIAKIKKLAIGPRMLYVSLTRATTPAFIHICLDCKCRTVKTKSYSIKLCAFAKKD